MPKVLRAAHTHILSILDFNFINFGNDFFFLKFIYFNLKRLKIMFESIVNFIPYSILRQWKSHTNNMPFSKSKNRRKKIRWDKDQFHSNEFSQLENGRRNERARKKFILQRAYDWHAAPFQMARVFNLIIKWHWMS